jgi:hypothetical protein
MNRIGPFFFLTFFIFGEDHELLNKSLPLLLLEQPLPHWASSVVGFFQSAFFKAFVKITELIKRIICFLLQLNTECPRLSLDFRSLTDPV